jgi:carboxymethylenebutenolidase
MIRRAAVVCLVALATAACGGGATRSSADAEYIDAIAREHADHTPVANAAARAPAQQVQARMVAYGVVSGDTVRGYLAHPGETAYGLPAVVLVHEWWGLNDNIRMMARRLAGEGYAVLAVDMFHGRVAADAAEARALTQAVAEDAGRGPAHLAAAAGFFAELGAPRRAVMGWCFGGMWALEGALRQPASWDASVVYYGRTVTDRERLAALRAPLLGIFGEADRGIPVAGVREMEAALRELGKDVQIHVYPGAGHGFANPSGQAYDAGAAEDAWTRTLRFLDRHLSGVG